MSEKVGHQLNKQKRLLVPWSTTLRAQPAALAETRFIQATSAYPASTHSQSLASHLVYWSIRGLQMPRDRWFCEPFDYPLSKSNLSNLAVTTWHTARIVKKSLH